MEEVMADNNQKESFSKISIQLAFLSPSKNMTLFEKLICSASDSRYPYVELIIDDKWLSLTNGYVRLKPIEQLNIVNYDYADLGKIKFSDDVLYNTISFLKSQEGKKVSKFNKLIINFTRFNIKVKDTWFDSELVTTVLQMLGIEETYVLDPQFTLPGDLAKIFYME